MPATGYGVGVGLDQAHIDMSDGSEANRLLAALQNSSSPDRRDAIEICGRTLSDADLLEAASGLAGAIAGAPSIAVHATASIETVVAVVAGLIAGVPVVPIPADAGRHERDHILHDSGAPIVLGDIERGDRPWGAADEVAQDFRIGLPSTVEFRTVDLGVRRSGPFGAGPPGDAPALILYTSGTTGPPKGVVVTRAAIAANLDGLAAVWQWTPDDVVVHGLPLFHVHGLVLGVLGALRHGSRLVHTGRPTADAYLGAVDAGGTLLFGVPTIWSRIASAPDIEHLRAARLLVSGSAALPEIVWTTILHRTGQRLVERYGMTETLITLAVPASRERRPGTVGLPVPGVTVRVVDEDGLEVEPDGDTIGNLEVRGPTLMAGYLNQPDATAASFNPDGWFVTGDVATVDGVGYHRIVGRASTDLIKTGGFRVGAGEVEAALLAHPAVQEAAVVGEPDSDLGQVIVAYVVSQGVGDSELISWVAERMSWHKRPRRVVLVDSLPRNALGKVQKVQLGQT